MLIILTCLAGKFNEYEFHYTLVCIMEFILLLLPIANVSALRDANQKNIVSTLVVELFVLLLSLQLLLLLLPFYFCGNWML